MEQQAQEKFMRLVDMHAAKEGITEKLKAEDSMFWVRRMNDIRSRAEEIVNKDLIYA